MKSSKLAVFMALGALGANTLAIVPRSAQAATFGQTEVNQSKFIAIAVPRSETYYNLTILEQVSDQRPCWQESGQGPTVVDPLLLGFNFTGICGRSSDSNGYSIRHQGQDLGLEYRLTLKRQQDDVVLLGVPSSSRKDPIVLGRTRGVSGSLMKIDLDPGWKFTKRNYQGKTLGHVYLTHEGTLTADKTARDSKPVGGTTRSSNSTPRSSTASVFQPSSRRPVAIPVPPPPQVAKASRSDRYYRLYVQAVGGRQEKLVRSMVPGAFRSSYRGQPVMQAGLFAKRSEARSLEKKLKRRGLRTNLIEERGPIPVAKASPSIFAPVAAGSVLQVPSSRVPLGNARGEGDVYGRGVTSTPPPPPDPRLALARRYRVYVPTSSSSQQSRIRRLVKDSFRSSYRGQPAMQVGSFTSRGEADNVIRLMQRNGFRTIID